MNVSSFGRSLSWLLLVWILLCDYALSAPSQTGLTNGQPLNPHDFTHIVQNLDPGSMTALVDIIWSPDTSSFVLQPKSGSTGKLVYPNPGNLNTGGTNLETPNPGTSSRTDGTTDPYWNGIPGYPFGFVGRFRPPLRNYQRQPQYQPRSYYPALLGFDAD